MSLEEWILEPKDIDSKVNHPSHYNKGKIEVITFIEDQKLDFHLGNVLKYICRADSKEGLQDLRKALWYLERKIELEESEVKLEIERNKLRVLDEKLKTQGRMKEEGNYTEL